jgi:phosphinothricin acetyltransferase
MGNDTPITPQIRIMTPADWPAVRAIYAAGIGTGDATFETEPPTWEQFDTTRLAGHRYVVTDTTEAVVGWVAATRVSEREAYRGVVEHSVYVDPDASGHGLGTALLRTLIDSTEAAGIWTIQSGVFPQNTVSLALHERAGFRVVGRRMRIGRLHGVWRDVILLERRSRVVG